MDRRELEIMLNDAFDRGIVTARAVEGIYPPAVTVGILDDLGREIDFGHEGSGLTVFLPGIEDDARFAGSCKALGGKVPQNTYRMELVYRLPDGSEPSGYAEMSVPADYADSSHVVPSVFISGTGGDRAWRDIDFDEAERKFAAAARRAAAFREGRPKLMQDEARRAAIRETRHRVCTAPILKSIKEIHR